MSGGDIPTGPAERAGAIVQTAVADATAQTQAELDAATQRANEAAATARAISDAAMQTEIGARVQAQQQEFQTWRTSQDQRIAQVEEANRLSTVQLQEATGLLGSIRQILTQPPVDAKPPVSAPVPVTAPTDGNSTGTGPNEKPKVAAETQPEPQRRSRHFL